MVYIPIKDEEGLQFHTATEILTAPRCQVMSPSMKAMSLRWMFDVDAYSAGLAILAATGQAASSSNLSTSPNSWSTNFLSITVVAIACRLRQH